MQSFADSFFTGDPHHLWLADDMRPWKYPRHPRRLRKEQDTHIGRRSGCRNEDLQGFMRQDRW